MVRIAVPGLRLGLLAVVLTMAAVVIIWVVSGTRIPLIGGRADAGNGGAARAGTLEHHLYFADGETGPDVWTSYAIFNPGPAAAHVLVVLRVGDAGLEHRRALTIDAGGHTRVLANELVGAGTFSAHLSSDQKVYAERTTLWLGGDGVSAQAVQPAATWYFGETEVGDGYRSTLAVYSPGAPAVITITCLFSDTQALTTTLSVPADVRMPINVGQLASGGRLGLVVLASRPVVAELTTVYAGGQRAYGGPGATALNKTWYAFATFKDGYRTRLALINPGNQAAVVRATVLPRGATPTRNLQLKAHSRTEFRLADDMVGKVAMVILEATEPLAVQEITTFAAGGEQGPAYSVMAAPAVTTDDERNAAKTAYLADTEASEGYDTYLLLYNPTSSAARIQVTFFVSAGAPVARSVTLGSRQRSTHLVRAEAFGMRTSAAVVRSNQPIIVERLSVSRSRDGWGLVATTGSRQK